MFPRRTKGLQFDTGILSCEAPVHPYRAPVALLLPRPHLPPQDALVRYAPAQALSNHHPDFNLGHIQPTAMLGSVVNLQPFGDAPRFGWFKFLVQRGRVVGVLPVPVVGGRSRQGAPVRRIQQTASIKRRLSWAGLPTLPSPPGRWGLNRSQTSSLISWRRCAAVIYASCPAVVPSDYHPILHLTTHPNTTAAHSLIWNVQLPAGVGSNLVPVETAVPSYSWALPLSTLADPSGRNVRL